MLINLYNFVLSGTNVIGPIIRLLSFIISAKKVSKVAATMTFDTFLFITPQNHLRLYIGRTTIACFDYWEKGAVAQATL